LIASLSIALKIVMTWAAAPYAFWNLTKFCVSSSMLMPSVDWRTELMLDAKLVWVVVPVVAAVAYMEGDRPVVAADAS